MEPLLEWFSSPIWIAFGALLVLLLIVIIAMAARGHGTTVMKE